MRRAVVTAYAAVVCALWSTPTALAATPAERVYGGQGGNIQGDVAAGGGSAGGVLPFTGLDLLMMVAAATLLIGAGFTMRRMAKARV